MPAAATPQVTEGAKALQRELWRRMAFNAICGYGDDHPRNHGLLFRDGRWGLSEAFDIAPYISFPGTLAMAITREGSALATTENLLKTCDNFAYDAKAAAEYIEQCKDSIAKGWGEELAACGQARDLLPAPTFEWLDGSTLR
ncbi:HipA domain-containing protein [Ramlibacter sp. 2FC]|uniref:HipA domain-containing protein n=1 Tax=Ramlibacter sp. 2FC TaxID=2502188 RepID=UPI0024C2F4DC|nr:HipA domain-containing protein [Ramlibacter sp. 2FC]